MTADWPEPLFRQPLVQPDPLSCGAAVVVVARAITDPAYGEQILSAPGSPQRFRDEVLAAHRRVTGPVDRTGRLQLPWPRALGTPPWGVARELGYSRLRLIRARAGSGYDALLATVQSGRLAPFYVGNRWLPRHVVLALGEHDGGLRCYEPASGRRVVVERSAFTDHRLALAGWQFPWFAVLP